MSQGSRAIQCISTGCSGIIAAFVLSACTGGPTATMTADATDPLASERLTSQEIAGITPPQAANSVPKRQPEDPIYVKLAPPALDSKMRQAEKPKGAIGQHIRNEFASDPIIQLLPESKDKRGQKISQSARRIADVEVASRVSLKEVRGGDGKPGKTVNVVFEATITSQSPPASYVVSESGPVLQNMAVSKRFAKQIREVIAEKIGPEIPAR